MMTSHETRSGSDTPETKTWAFDRSCTEKLSEALIFAQIFVTCATRDMGNTLDRGHR